MYIAPTDAGGFSDSKVSIGKKAASVFPEAVDAERSTFSSVSNIASQAATCMPLREDHPFLYI
jgi:hypothetical protein